MKKPWTTAEIALLREYREQRVPVFKIAELLERSIPSVTNQIKALNLLVSPRKPWRTLDDARLKSLIANGTPWAQIGEQMGRSTGSCMNRARALGVNGTRAPKSWKTGEVAELEQAVFAVIERYANRYSRPASAVRCKAMHLLCKFNERQEKAA